MRRGLILVKAAYDADAAVWFVESSDLEGVNAEAPSLEALLQKLPAVVLDLLEEEGLDDVELPIEVVAHASTRVRRSTAALRATARPFEGSFATQGASFSGRAAAITRSGRARRRLSRSPCR